MSENSIPERKPKQRRKFTWTPARRAAFEKCRKAREAKLAARGSTRNLSSSSPPPSKTTTSKRVDPDDLAAAKEQARRVMEALRRHEMSDTKSEKVQKTAEKVAEVNEEMQEPTITNTQLHALMSKLEQLQSAIESKHSRGAQPSEQKKKKRPPPRQQLSERAKKKAKHREVISDNGESDEHKDSDVSDESDMSDSEEEEEEEEEAPKKHTKTKKQASRKQSLHNSASYRNSLPNNDGLCRAAVQPTARFKFL